jgi:hypothetical protein
MLGMKPDPEGERGFEKSMDETGFFALTLLGFLCLPLDMWFVSFAMIALNRARMRTRLKHHD